MDFQLLQSGAEHAGDRVLKPKPIINRFLTAMAVQYSCPSLIDRDDDRLEERELHSLNELLDALEQAARSRGKLSLGNALDAINRRSFAPLLLLPGLIMAVPGPADIPGVPVVLGLLVIIIAVQMILRRDHLWIPHWMEKRQVEGRTIMKMVRWMRTPARWLDRVTKQRLSGLVDHGGYPAIAVACIIIAASTPLLEFVPFSANIAGIAITAFGLALMARDGLLAALAILLSLSCIAIVGYQFL